MIIGFSYYRLSSLDDPESRQRTLQINEDARVFQEAGADDYIGRYNRQALIQSMKANFYKNDRKSNKA